MNQTMRNLVESNLAHESNIAIVEQEPDSIASLPRNIANTLARHGMVNIDEIDRDSFGQQKNEEFRTPSKPQQRLL